MQDPMRVGASSGAPRDAARATMPFRVAALLAALTLAVPSPAAAVLPEGGDAEAFARLSLRMQAAPGVAWSVEDDLVVPALPDIDHVLDDLALASSGAGSYPSLATALLMSGASGVDSGSVGMFGSDVEGLSALTGLDAFELSRLDLSSPEAFDQALTSAGSGFSLTSLDTLMGRLGSPSPDVDAASVASASSFATGLWALNMPQIPTAPMPEVDAAALGFGLLTNRSLTAFATDFPDVFASASSSGLGTDEHQRAWEESMANAFAASEADLTAALPSPCLAGMLAVAASGSPESAAEFSDCGPDCQAAGVYLNSQLLGLWAPSAFSNQPVDDSVLSAAEMERLPGWLSAPISGQIAAQSSTGSGQAPPTALSAEGSLQGGCATAPATSGALSRTMPGILGALGR